MLNIGEFSKITGLTVKAIHLYHEKGLLVPHAVDEKTGYRYFDQKNVEQARVIVSLREMQFSLEEIRQLFRNCTDDQDAVVFLEDKKSEIEAHVRQLKSINLSLDRLIQREKEAVAMLNSHEFEVEERTQEPLLIAGIRWKGRYEESGTYFGKLGKAVGRYICGKAMNLYFDVEHKEADADIESCFPIRKKIESSAVTVESLPAGKFVTLVHKGPYDNLGRSYEKIFSYLNQKGYKPAAPIREVYLKGPGMLFRGNPKNYLTEIQIAVN